MRVLEKEELLQGLRRNPSLSTSSRPPQQLIGKGGWFVSQTCLIMPDRVQSFVKKNILRDHSIEWCSVLYGLHSKTSCVSVEGLATSCSVVCIYGDFYTLYLFWQDVGLQNMSDLSFIDQWKFQLTGKMLKGMIKNR